MSADMDEQLDARLRADAAAWRTQHDSRPIPEFRLDQALPERAAAPTRRWVAVAVSVAAALLLAAGIGLWSASTNSPPAAHRPTPNATTDQAHNPPLVGTEWQLASYRNRDDGSPTTVATDSTLEISAAGHVTATACNTMGGTASVTARTISVGSLGSTLMACSGEPGILDAEVTATLTGKSSWSITRGILTLSNANGHVLTYRVRPSIYPNLAARTIITGNRGGGQYRLAVEGRPGHLGLVFEERTAPGEPWGQAGVAAPAPGDCLADSVIRAGSLGTQTFVATWATPDVAKVTTQTTADAPQHTLTFYDVPGTTLRIAGLWATSFRPSISPVTFYDRNNHIIAAYPRGPC